MPSERDPYRGAFNPWRPPHPGCPVENERSRAYGAGRCGIPDPFTGMGYYCTRGQHHEGDHVARRSESGLVVVRWAPTPGDRASRGRN